MKRTKPYRRFQIEQAKRRARARIRRWTTWHAEWGPGVEERLVGIYARTPKPCSCIMCGNPRRHFGARALQERRADSATGPDGRYM